LLAVECSRKLDGEPFLTQSVIAREQQRTGDAIKLEHATKRRLCLLVTYELVEHFFFDF
jgi:hypothetical protein